VTLSLCSSHSHSHFHSHSVKHTVSATLLHSLPPTLPPRYDKELGSGKKRWDLTLLREYSDANADLRKLADQAAGGPPALVLYAAVDDAVAHAVAIAQDALLDGSMVDPTADAAFGAPVRKRRLSLSCAISASLSLPLARSRSATKRVHCPSGVLRPTWWGGGR
jgi:hypothetical protein